MTDAKCVRALVIDDEPLAREMVREMLEGDPEAEIIGECGNGRAAVEAIHSKLPDLIFLDIDTLHYIEAEGITSEFTVETSLISCATRSVDSNPSLIRKSFCVFTGQPLLRSTKSRNSSLGSTASITSS